MKMQPSLCDCKYSFCNILFFVLISSGLLSGQDNFRVFPYLQNPGPDAITIIWFSEKASPGLLSYWLRDSDAKISVNSVPVLAESLTYSEWEAKTFFEGQAPPAPFRHRIRIENLESAEEYEYSVTQGLYSFSSSFKTAPVKNTSVRFIVYADSETEPESHSSYTEWIDPANGSSRSYFVDQTTGYQNNLHIIRSRNPDLVFISGDLVESGGEQRDWDEFWHHNTNPDSGQSIAGKVPLMPALGNHEYYEGPFLDQYNQPGSERAVRKFLTYFESPSNNASNEEHEGRYYSIKYGPATFIVLDVCNNGLNKSGDDTNFYLLGEKDTNGGNAPDFGPGSGQYSWLLTQLAEAQLKSMFTFIICHHAPFSSGPHGFPPGEVENTDNQSGNPVRLLTPVFMEYGVDAVISGHDEIWERSEISGKEIQPDQSEVTHTINFYDVGVGGDGLRGPEEGLNNPYKKFLVHTDVPEIWENDILKAGGKHYGHLEIDILPIDDDKWCAVLKPAYVFPLKNVNNQTYSDFERRTYSDEIILTRYYSDIIEPVELTTFSVTPANNGIAINWESETEKGNYGFELQRRLGSDWQSVVFLEGKGTTILPGFYEYIDACPEILAPGNKIYYRLKQVCIDGNFFYSDSVFVEIPEALSCSQNYPNPFKAATTIDFYLPETCHVTASIFDLQGQLLRIIEDKKMDIGFYNVIWDGKDNSGKTVNPGIYFFRIDTGSGQTDTKQLIFVK